MSFDDPQAVASYAQGPARLVPGFEALQRMAALLLEESVPVDGRVLARLKAISRIARGLTGMCANSILYQ